MYFPFYTANNKGADQTVRKQVYSHDTSSLMLS